MCAECRDEERFLRELNYRAWREQDAARLAMEAAPATSEEWVAHLDEMNHGPRFWRLVESLSPGSAGPRAWLKRHRNQLFSYG